MVQGAVYDAVNAIDRGHRAYLPQPQAPRSASKDAAAATAAYQVLAGLFPAQQPALQSLYERRSPASPTARPARRRTGSPPAPRQRRRCSPRARTTAASDRSRPCTARRRGSTGRRRRSSRPTRRPGSGTSGRSWSRTSRCCARRPPTPLTSRAYARELNEIKDVGALHSTTRTPDQTSAAIFWQDHAFALWNRTFRTLADEPASGHRRQRAAVRDREPGRRRRRDRLLEQQVPLEHVAPDHGDPRGRDRREPGHRRPTRTGHRCSTRPRRSRAARARHPAVPGVPLRPQLRRRRDPGLAPVLLPHRPRRVQRVQQQERDDAQLAQPLRGTEGEHQRARMGRDPLPAAPTSPASRSARRSRATSTTTTSSPASDAAPRPRAEATAPTAAPPPRSWCGRGGGAVTGPRERRACARSARGGTRRTAGSGRCSACGSSPRARRTSERVEVVAHPGRVLRADQRG